MKNKEKALLDIKNLNISYRTKNGEAKAVRDASITISQGEIIGIAGESGSGKSTLANAAARLLDKSAKVISGEIVFEDTDILKLTEAQMQSIRGAKIGMIFQNPASSFNPVYTIGNQIIEALTCHIKLTRKQAHDKAVIMLKTAGLENAEYIMKQYPHQLSGGMLQRAMIAMALMCSPKLLIADEATTALDASVQAQILRLLKDISIQENISIMFITHNLLALKQICDKIAVMYGGRIVETGSTDEIFTAPAHPYTRGLIDCMPDIGSHERYLKTLQGEPADILRVFKGCEFAERCPECMKICIKQKPPKTQLSENHFASCWMHCKAEVKISEQC
ncbi:MAG: ABC transporter ATP-binding protein [Eubacteriaceae bacterium]|nr:ABC transporter ATP-binding protein [Eubacteriaceae bacterium]